MFVYAMNGDGGGRSSGNSTSLLSLIRSMLFMILIGIRITDNNITKMVLFAVSLHRFGLVQCYSFLFISTFSFLLMLCTSKILHNSDLIWVQAPHIHIFHSHAVVCVPPYTCMNVSHFAQMLKLSLKSKAVITNIQQSWPERESERQSRNIHTDIASMTFHLHVPHIIHTK